MGEAPEEMEDCPSAEACDNGCDQHPRAEKDAVVTALKDAERVIREHAERRARTAFVPWFNPIAGARAEGRVGGLDKAADLVQGLWEEVSRG